MKTDKAKVQQVTAKLTDELYVGARVTMRKTKFAHGGLGVITAGREGKVWTVRWDHWTTECHYVTKDLALA
jgi:hypothetical protein